MGIYKSSKKLKIFVISFCCLAVLSGIGFITYPFFSNLFGNLSQERAINQWEEIRENLNTDSIVNNSLGSEQPQVSDNNSINNLDVSVSNGNKYDYLVPNDLMDKDFFEKLGGEDYFPLKINIPKIQVEWLVNEGTDIKTLKKGPGHYIETKLPGQVGRCAIAGHRTTYGAPFNQIDLLQSGDLIYLETYKGLIFTYVVTGTVIARPTDVFVLNGSNTSDLILTTCEPKYSAAKRLIVIAKLIEIIPVNLKFDL
jgi:LPXTG-site transpeptidase (sortase) family protein